MIKKTIVPVNISPIEEATPQVEDIVKIEEATPLVEAGIAKVEPEIIQIKEETLKVADDIKPTEKVTKVKKEMISNMEIIEK